MFDKQDYKLFKREAKESGTRVATREVFDANYNGVTVAYRKVFPSTECRMIEVAVSYCAPEDEYKRKFGKFEALHKMWINETVQLPIAGFLDYFDEECADEAILDIFTI